ncbi:MAG: ABC transporter substrate-binding protein [Xanthobacteraceae bacterium]|jgi:putative tryptophan/tyrosine transport system substrate-binding protein
MKRREFICLLGGAAAWPIGAEAQQSRVPVLGFLASASEARYTATLAAVRKGLNEAGYVEKQNLLIEYRWADFQYERLPALAAELVNRSVDAIFATGSVVSAIAAKSATASIPIVFANGSDPVQYGLVASLNRPGGNVTGITFINSQLGPKRIQLLRLLNPKTAVIAVLVNPRNPNAADAKTFEAAGRSIGVQIVIVNASTEAELKEAFDRATQQHADALLVHVDALFNDNGEPQIVTLAAQHRLPTMMANQSFTPRGGLISYGADTRDLNRQAGIYVARILRGEKPADLPVVQPTNFALRINLKTANALGLSIPESFLLLADEVIE